MFFVPNTGRSGSKTVAMALSQSPDCECLHEPEPRLVEEASRFRYGSIEPAAIVEILRRTRRAARPSAVYGETHNKLSLIVPLIELAFPGSKYLWLVRDGRDVVASSHQRGWFGIHEYAPGASPWARWRLQGDAVGEVDPSEWASWDAFERCCWNWNYVNRLIQGDLEEIDAQRRRLLRIEELGAKLPELCEFLGITPVSFVIDRANRRVSDGDAEEARNLVPSVITWHDWSPEQKAVFVKHCGALMDELYPGWREGDDWRDTRSEVHSGAVVVDFGRQTSHESHDVGAIRLGMAELKLLRGDLRAAIRLQAAVEGRWEKQVEAMTETISGAREELAAARERARRAEKRAERADTGARRAKAAAADAIRERRALADEVKAVTDRARKLEAEYRKAISERNRERDRANALLRSTSYRFGNLIVMLAKHPVRTSRRILVKVWRLAKGSLRTAGIHRATKVSANIPTKDVRPSAAPDEVVRNNKRSDGGTPESRRSILSDEFPVYSYVALGFDEAKLRELASSVRQYALVRGNHVPMIITDSPSFALVRHTGVAVEYIPDQETWEKHRSDMGWALLRTVRLAYLLRTHKPANTFFVSPLEPLDLPALLELSPDR